MQVRELLKRYALYLLRWQLSTPILAICLVFFSFGVTWNTVLANLIGGLIFFWVDKFIFTSKIIAPQWEVVDDVICVDCKKAAVRGYRLVKAKNYDKTNSVPEFRCEKCSQIKSRKQKQQGILKS